MARIGGYQNIRVGVRRTYLRGKRHLTKLVDFWRSNVLLEDRVIRSTADFRKASTQDRQQFSYGNWFDCFQFVFHEINCFVYISLDKRGQHDVRARRLQAAWQFAQQLFQMTGAVSEVCQIWLGLNKCFKSACKRLNYHWNWRHNQFREAGLTNRVFNSKFQLFE